MKAAYTILHEFDIICLLETYLDSTAHTDDDKLQIPGYTLIPWYEEESEVPLFKSGPRSNLSLPSNSGLQGSTFQPSNIMYDPLKEPYWCNE